MAIVGLENGLAAEITRYGVFAAMGIVLFFIIRLWFKVGLSTKTINKVDDIAVSITDKDSLSELVQKAYYSSWTTLSCDVRTKPQNTAPDSNKQSGQTIPDIDNCAPQVFIDDAIFQYGMAHFERKWVEPYEALVNIFPPLGFLGTILGMTMIFMSSNGSIDAGIKSSGMGTALLTTVAALFLYVIFELIKIGRFSKAESCVRKSIINAQRLLSSEKQKKYKAMSNLNRVNWS
ncbi:MotA/TolQ/ExbB proton channel family protein [Maridesulfovibrio sp.]|uniref:MotA/TolQ/ExbB proton channel family protein n=1 Tax=Maridesulfovibrio sp. TaxID=2795000 RepID=UPI003B009DA1